MLFWTDSFYLQRWTFLNSILTNCSVFNLMNFFASFISKIRTCFYRVLTDIYVVSYFIFSSVLFLAGSIQYTVTLRGWIVANIDLFIRPMLLTARSYQDIRAFSSSKLAQVLVKVVLLMLLSTSSIQNALTLRCWKRTYIVFNWNFICSMLLTTSST